MKNVIIIGILASLLLVRADAYGCTQKRHHHDPKVEEMILQESRRRNNLNCKQCIVINTYFWTFHGTVGLVEGDFDEVKADDNPTEAMMIEQFDVLVDLFSNTPFTFRLMGNQIIQNHTYYVEAFDDNVDQVVLDYRVGGHESLNVYFGGVNQGSFATMAGVAFETDPTPIGDAAFVDIGTVPGLPKNANSNEEGRSLGHTLVHEVGHWLVRY